MSKKKRQKKLLQVIQSASGLKACTSAKLGKQQCNNNYNSRKCNQKHFWLAIPLDSKHPIYTYGVKEDLIVRLEMNSSGKVILSNKENTATYTLADISLEYDAIFGKLYATTIVELSTSIC